MYKILLHYLRMPRHLLLLIGAEFCVQLINTSFFLILNYFLAAEGYPDFKIADFISFRFLSVMVLAFPLGLFIKGRRLMPFFYTATLASPTLAMLIIFAIQAHMEPLIYAGLILWGLAFTCIQITVLPYILRNAHRKHHSEAFSLHFITWSSSTFVSGFLIYGLSSLNPELFTEQTLLTLISMVGYAGFFLIAAIQVKEHVPAFEGARFDLKKHDWPLIIRAVIPTLIIATGAGLTIPFINLFFLHVFDMSYDTFSLIGSFTTVLVAGVMFFVPTIKNRYGYGVSITLMQTLAVLFLVLLATTEYYRHLPFALGVAVACYMIRQPLMNMAGPMTSELCMYYVGKRNQEILSALLASIWSGSWFFSSQLFRVLREANLRYATIFLLTAGLYAIGVIGYYFLILEYKKQRQAEIEVVS